MASEVIQAVILVLGVVPIFLMLSTRPSAKLVAGFIGLLTQPFFLFATYQAHQWGMFALSCVYCVAWASQIGMAVKAKEQQDRSAFNAYRRLEADKHDRFLAERAAR